MRLWTSLFAVLGVIPVLSSAQISWTGIYDFEFRKGGAGSSLERNDVMNRHPHFLVHRLQLFIDAEVDQQISFTAKLQNNVIIGEKLKDIEIQLAHLTYSGLFGEDINISAGRILTPFGQFARRQLSTDNPLIGYPLHFHYQLKVSPVIGYNPNPDPSLAYGGLSTMYIGGYNTGVEVFGTTAGGFIDYDFAVMNAPMSLYTSDISTSSRLSFQGRVGIQPFMFLGLGLSGNYGRFIDESLPGLRGFSYLIGDSVVRKFDENIGKYNQLTAGIDLTFSWGFYTVFAEYLLNRWDAPFFTPLPPTYPYRRVENVRLINREILVDARVDVPFVVGLYVAARLNVLTFDDIDNPLSRGTSVAWDDRVRRYAVGVGYKLARTVTLKGGYEWTLLDINPRPYLNVWGVQLSAML